MSTKSADVACRDTWRMRTWSCPPDITTYQYLSSPQVKLQETTPICPPVTRTVRIGSLHSSKSCQYRRPPTDPMNFLIQHIDRSRLSCCMPDSLWYNSNPPIRMMNGSRNSSQALKGTTYHRQTIMAADERGSPGPLIKCSVYARYNISYIAIDNGQQEANSVWEFPQTCQN